MGWKNSAERYGLLSIGFHWLMFLLMIAVYACIELRVLYPKGSDPRDALKAWHFMLGLSMFFLVWLRLVVRLLQPTPQPQSGMKSWQTSAAKVMHYILYLFMVAMPLMGWLILSAEGKTIPFFSFELPALMAENHDIAENIEETHEIVGTIGYVLISLHTLAALFHHYLLKDNTVRRMLPTKMSFSNKT